MTTPRDPWLLDAASERVALGTNCELVKPSANTSHARSRFCTEVREYTLCEYAVREYTLCEYSVRGYAFKKCAQDGHAVR